MLQKSKIIIVTICKDNIEQLNKTKKVFNFMPSAFSLVIDSSKIQINARALSKGLINFEFIFTPPIYNAMNISFEFLDNFDYVSNSGDNLISRIDFLDNKKSKLIMVKSKL